MCSFKIYATFHLHNIFLPKPMGRLTYIILIAVLCLHLASLHKECKPVWGQIH